MATDERVEHMKGPHGPEAWVEMDYTSCINFICIRSIAHRFFESSPIRPPPVRPSVVAVVVIIVVHRCPSVARPSVLPSVRRRRMCVVVVVRPSFVRVFGRMSYKHSWPFLPSHKKRKHA